MHCKSQKNTEKTTKKQQDCVGMKNVSIPYANVKMNRVRHHVISYFKVSPNYLFHSKTPFPTKQTPETECDANSRKSQISFIDYERVALAAGVYVGSERWIAFALCIIGVTVDITTRLQQRLLANDTIRRGVRQPALRRGVTTSHGCQARLFCVMTTATAP